MSSDSSSDEEWKRELLEMWRIWGGIDRQRRVKGNSSQRQQLSNRKTEYIQNKVGSPSWIERWIFHSLLGGLSKRQIDQILKKEKTKVVKPGSITVPTYNKRQQQGEQQQQQGEQQQQQGEQQQQQGEQQQRKRKREQQQQKRQHEEKFKIFMKTIRKIDPDLLTFDPLAIQSVLDVTPEPTRNLLKFRGNLSTICTSSDVNKDWIEIFLEKMKTIATSTDPAKLQKYEETVLQPIYNGDITLLSLYINLVNIEHLST